MRYSHAQPGAPGREALFFQLECRPSGRGFVPSFSPLGVPRGKVGLRQRASHQLLLCGSRGRPRWVAAPKACNAPGKRGEGGAAREPESQGGEKRRGELGWPRRAELRCPCHFCVVCTPVYRSPHYSPLIHVRLLNPSTLPVWRLRFQSVNIFIWFGQKRSLH